MFQTDEFMSLTPCRLLSKPTITNTINWTWKHDSWILKAAIPSLRKDGNGENVGVFGAVGVSPKAAIGFAGVQESWKTLPALAAHPVVFTCVSAAKREWTSRIEFGQQMRSGDLLAYLSLNRLLNGVLSCSRFYFVRIQSISQKFNSCVSDGRTDGRTDGQTHPLIEMRERI